MKLHISSSGDEKKNRPVVIFYHGAGFSNNKVNAPQFQHLAAHFTSLGMVSISAEYRLLEKEGLFSPIESLINAKSAIRWVREKADELGIDPNKVIAAGASAGGYLCLCCAQIEHFNDPNDDVQISSVPDAMIIFNGGVNSKPLIDLFPELADELLISLPIYHIKEGLPPSLLFHGTNDLNIPLQDIIAFTDTSKRIGNSIKLVTFEGMGHGFFNFGAHDNIPYHRTLLEMETFLKDLDF
ncbi:alpha/beta hydrolase [Paenibacillus sp. FSL R5-0407]|uniref:alpha/beta hydrolase n=1 Tax=Paenibacillus sp. FSL R5-0407 TaxID=2975320 RepID=UPI0030F741DD